MKPTPGLSFADLLQVERIRVLLANAAQGAWWHCCDGENHKCEHMVWAFDADPEMPVCDTHTTKHLNGAANAALIAAAPAGLALLLRIIDRLTSAAESEQVEGESIGAIDP